MFKFLYSNLYEQISKITSKSTTNTTNTDLKTASLSNEQDEEPSSLIFQYKTPKSPRLDTFNRLKLSSLSTDDIKQQEMDSTPITPSNTSYTRAYSLSSPTTSTTTQQEPSNYLNLSTPNYFSKNQHNSNMPPKETPLKSAKSKADHASSRPKTSSLNRTNTMASKIIANRQSSGSSSSSSFSTSKSILNKLTEFNHVKTNTFTSYNNNNNNSNELGMNKFPLKHNLNAEFTSLINNAFQSLVHYGDNIGAKVVKCLINENLYETSSLINQDYDIYQGPALCVTYDSILKDEHWDEIFICQDEDSAYASASNGTKPHAANGATSPPSGQSKTKSFIGSRFSSSKATNENGTANGSTGPQPTNHASKFISFFHISDFIAILSGYKVAFVDPYERFNNDERSYVAIFDLENDTQDIEQFEDQFKPLEKIFNVPLLKNRYYNGTIIRLPLRTQTSSCSVSNKLVHVKDILMNAKDFMKEAHLHILFAKNISNIQFCRTKDSQNIEKVIRLFYFQINY